jgi:hypothetical protein
MSNLPARRPASSAPTRFRHALTTPLAAITGVAGAAMGALAGGAGESVAAAGAGAVALGAVGWAAGAGVAAFARRERRERIDPFTLGEPWRHFVRGALQAKARYDKTLAETRPGPLRDRLVDIGRRIDVGVHECWEVAQRGDALKDAIRAIDVPGVQRRMEALSAAPDDPTNAAMLDALQARLDSAARLRAVSEEAENRLRLLDARLGEAVARGVELSVHRGEGTEAAGLGADVDDLVLELTALRAALDETEGGPTAGPDTNTAGS